MSQLSRRSLLKGSLAAGLMSAASLGGFNAVFGFSRVLGQAMEDDSVETIINLAATAELFATTHYYAAIQNAAALGLDEGGVNYMKAGMIAEADHYDLLASLGAVPVVTEFYVPETLFSDAAVFAATTEVAETTFVGAYLGATRIFSKNGQPNFAVTTAQIAAVEAEHRLFARQLQRLLPNNLSYAQFLYNNVSEAVPVLQPFLDGSGEGFIGPVTPPTAEQIAAVRADADMIGYNTESLPYAAIAAM
ncbi:MAG TPA: ferritin-like domain-containing protein [Aggregatilineales bacterium]|nr:ferritin-like domain-containing protein [Aggregatilineales bacterium]